MFAKFPNLPETGKASDDARDAAGHGRKALDWSALRARLSAERDLRSAISKEALKPGSWIRPEGSFDPVAAEALCSRNDVRSDGRVGRMWAEYDDEESCLPDPNCSAGNTEIGSGGPHDRADKPTGTSVED